MNAIEELAKAGAQLDQFFTPAYVAQAQAYAEPLRIRWAVDLTLLYLEYAVIFGFRLHVKLHEACARLAARANWPALKRFGELVWRGPGLGAALLFVCAFEAVLQLLDIPESVYFDFFRERSEGVSNYTAASYAYDQVKDIARDMIATAILMAVLYALMRWLPRAWPWILGAIGGVAVIFLGGVLDPLESRFHNDYKPLEAGVMRDAVLHTLDVGKIQFQDVLVENTSRTTKRADAFFAGRGPTRVIVLTDNLIENFTPSEVANVVAHEMGHLGENLWPARIGSGVALFLGLIALAAVLRAFATRGWLGLRNADDIAGYIVIFMLFKTITYVAAPVSNWRARARETDADHFALTLLRDPQNFLTMMAKLTARNRADPAPPGWYEAWRFGHPAAARRLAHALQFAHDNGIAVTLPTPQDAVKLPLQ